MAGLVYRAMVVVRHSVGVGAISARVLVVPARTVFQRVVMGLVVLAAQRHILAVAVVEMVALVALVL
ncbi:hypothetical protein ACL2XO_07710 [Sodalis sp. RH15]|uniref:hypothetical protein n=1 Tax=Sodalis sp. RH15 TaxID=3394330 RepID=UPI0039B61416